MVKAVSRVMKDIWLLVVNVQIMNTVINIGFKQMNELASYTDEKKIGKNHNISSDGT